MDIIPNMTEWSMNIELGGIKCGRLKPHSSEDSFRSTVASLNRKVFYKRGLALHVRSYWKENAVGIICVSREEFDEHKNDPVYENQWQRKIDDFHDRLLKAEELD